MLNTYFTENDEFKKHAKESYKKTHPTETTIAQSSAIDLQNFVTQKVKSSKPQTRECVVPITEKPFVTINEMAKIVHIGHNTIRRMVRANPQAEFILWVGTRAYIKRELFNEVLMKQNAI